jgi:uncharacterized membrane protein
MRIARAGGMHTTALTTIDPRTSALDRAWDRADSSLDGAPPGRDSANGHSLRSRAERRARTLGYFSLALGVAQLTLSGPLARLIGLKDTARSRRALRAIGAREIASGIGLLARQPSPGPVWSRVAGDAVDLALLGTSLSDNPASRVRLLAVSAAVAGITTLDVLSAARLSRHEAVQKLALPVHVVRSITINRPPETVYHFWRDLENLPRFMAHLESVRKNEDGTSVWRAKAPAGLSIEWQAEITLDRPNESLAWRSLEGASVPNRGVVRFKPGPAGRGTEVLVELKYDPPGGALSAAIAKLFGEEPGQQIAGDLRRLKQVLETGSIVHSDASIHCGLHAARPAAEGEPVTILGKDEA